MYVQGTVSGGYDRKSSERYCIPEIIVYQPGAVAPKVWVDWVLSGCIDKWEASRR